MNRQPYKAEKRRKELARQKKQEEKRQKRQEKKKLKDFPGPEGETPIAESDVETGNPATEGSPENPVEGGESAGEEQS